MIIIPTKWLFHWGYTVPHFQTNPYVFRWISDRSSLQPPEDMACDLTSFSLALMTWQIPVYQGLLSWFHLNKATFVNMLFKVAPNTPNTRGGTWLIKWLNDPFPSLVAIIYIQWIGAIINCFWRLETWVEYFNNEHVCFEEEPKPYLTNLGCVFAVFALPIWNVPHIIPILYCMYVKKKYISYTYPTYIII